MTLVAEKAFRFRKLISGNGVIRFPVWRVSYARSDAFHFGFALDFTIDCLTMRLYRRLIDDLADCFLDLLQLGVAGRESSSIQYL